MDNCAPPPRMPRPISKAHCSGPGQDHTKDAGTRMIGIMTRDMYTVMVALDSVALRRLMMIMHPPQINDEMTTSIGPRSSGMNPGRRITSVPAKPRKIAVQRRRRTTSPRNRTARTEAKMGAENPSAVTWARGAMDSAKK